MRLLASSSLCFLLKTSRCLPSRVGQFVVARGGASTSSSPERMDNDAIAYNSYASAAVDLSNAHVTKHGLLTVTRSCRDIDNNTRRKFLYTIPIHNNIGIDLHEGLIVLPPCERHDTILLRLPSPSGDKVAIFKSQGGAKEETKDQILEVWTEGGQQLERRIDLVAASCNKQRHGKVLADASGGFGLPSWNADETVIVYTAERNSIETSSFFESPKDGSVVGAQHELAKGKMEHWGEKYASTSPLQDLWCANVKTGKVGRIENAPRQHALGQPVFSTDESSIVYTGWDSSGEKMPRRLGLIYCQQRPCQLYRSDISKLIHRLADASTTEPNVSDNKDVPCSPLTAQHRLSHSPRFVGGKLIFLTSVKGFETHMGCFALGVINDIRDSAPKILVEQVWNPAADSPESAGKVAGMQFPGLFLQQLPMSCMLSSDFILTTTQWGSCAKIVRISLRDGSISLVQCEGGEFSSHELLCTTPEGGAVIASKTPGQPALLYHVSSDQLVGDMKGAVKCTLLARMPSIAATSASPVPSISSLIGSFDIKVIDAPILDGIAFSNPIQSILMLPNKTDHPQPPLIVVPHGGPHSASSTTYMPSYAFLCGHGGYAILLVNYRGSAGFGQGSIEALPSNIGTLDLQDVVAATMSVKGSGLVDPVKSAICGGSHGGFLTAHATSQYPDLFAAAVMRNPVVNLPSMVTATDIPDWCYVEACGSYHWGQYKPPTQAQLQTFHSKSPIQFIDRVKTPTLVALGLKDLRVPPSQGLEWFHTLRSMGVPSKLLTYENDDHAIDGVSAEADHWINIKRFLDEHLR